MTKVRVQDATKELSTNVSKLIEDISRMHKQAQDVLGTLRKNKDDYAQKEHERQQEELRKEQGTQMSAYSTELKDEVRTENAPKAPEAAKQPAAEKPAETVAAPKAVAEEKNEPEKQAAPKAEKTEKAVKETPPKEAAPQATAKKPTPAPAPKPQPAPNTQMPSKPQEAKPSPDAVSRRQKLQERVRLAGQKERAAKAALLQKKIKR